MIFGMNTVDVLTIAGAIFGIIVGWIIGSSNIYSRINKTNLHRNDIRNHPSSNLDSQTRFLCFFVGGIFFIIGIVILIVCLSGVIEPDGEIGAGTLAVFGFLCSGMGGLVLVPAISGKSST